MYDVDAAMLVHLDDLEQYPVFYTRTPTKCSLVTPSNSGETGHVLDCEAYFLEDFKSELLQLPMLSSYTGEPPEQKPFRCRENRVDIDLMTIMKEVKILKNDPQSTT